MSIEFDGQKVSAIVLDFNGTFYLTDKEFQKTVWKDARLRLVQKTFELEGKTSVNGMVFGSRLEDFVQEAIKEGWRVTFKKYGGTDAEFDEIINDVNLAEYLQFDQELAEFIAELMKHIPVYLFSSSEMERVFGALEAVIGELAKQLENQILSGDKMERARKPQPEAFQEMIEKLGVNPQETIYVDNSWKEADVAAELGFITFLVAPKVGSSTMNSHVVLNRLAQLKDHIVFK